MSQPVRTRLVLATTAATLVLVTACGSSTPSVSGATQPASASASNTAVTLTNCGEEVTYNTPATRVVATSNSTNIGTLLKVGAGPELAALALNSGNTELMKALYGVDLSALPKLTSPISLEAIVAVEPDLLIGSYSGLFAGSTGVTPEAANAVDIATYVISDSCRQDPSAGADSKLGTMDPWDAVRTDTANYGALTGHQDEAKAALDELESRLAALKSAPQGDKAPKVLLFDSGTDELYTSGHNGPPQGILDAAGAENVFASEDTTWFKASWESVAETQPDAIVVMDYRSDDANEVASKLETIRSQAALKDSPAVKNNRIIVLPLAMFTSGYPNIEAAEQIRLELEGMGLLPSSGIESKLPEGVLTQS